MQLLAAGRPWYANIRLLAVPVVAAYVIVCIVYVIIRALKSVDHIASPAYGKVVLAFEALGMVSLLQAGINHLYKVGQIHHVCEPRLEQLKKNSASPLRCRHDFAALLQSVLLLCIAAACAL